MVCVTKCLGEESCPRIDKEPDLWAGIIVASYCCRSESEAIDSSGLLLLLFGGNLKGKQVIEASVFRVNLALTSLIFLR